VGSGDYVTFLFAALLLTSVNVRVVDETGAPLPGVLVELQAEHTATSGVTDDTGAFVFTGVPPGRARLTFKLINFSTQRRELTVVDDKAAMLTVVMRLSLTADVTVTAERTFRNIADLDNPAENIVGIAASASQGAITAAQLEARPISRAGEVLETVPGLVVSQHSGEGKANQYYLRGFNLDHGTDFATTIAGVPVNMPTHAHGHGYSDNNFLVPELVSGVQYKKGPYFADEGDFSAAGAANINYVNQLERPIARVSFGGQGWGRVLAAASPRVGSGHLLGAIEISHNDGPWERPDDYQKANGVVRYSRGDVRNGYSVIGMFYRARWDATDQIPDRAVASGALSRFGHIDPTDGGSTHRASAAVDFQRSSSRASTRASAYVMRYGLELFSNFTYFLDDPINGDQFEQSERRTVAGGRVTHRRLGSFFGRSAENAIGAQFRHDAIGTIGLFKTVAQQRLSTVREDGVNQSSLGTFAQSEIEWSRVLRTTVGLRADVFRFDVRAGDPVNSGREHDTLVSPKFGAVLGPWADTELYVNAGMGFHSNDARGATIVRDPVTGDPVDRVTPLARARGAEVGLRTVKLRGVQTTVALWALGLDSELLFIGDAGTTEASAPTRRYGIEWANYGRLNRWMTFDVDLSFSRAEFTGDDSGLRVPGAVNRVVQAGLTVEPSRPLFGSIRLRHFGPRPLVEDASVMSRSTTVVNAEVGYRLSSRARLVLEAFNLGNAKASDIDYFYTSRLPGEPLAGVDDVHTHPTPPRTARIALHVAF
jgi:hypothetical protein